MSAESTSSFEENWPEVHRQLNSEKDEKTVLEGKYLDASIAKNLKTHKENDSTKKRRDGLIRHLQKIFSTRFKGSNLQAFGSSQTGLNLRNGDVDLCLIINAKDVKKILKRMLGILNDQCMEDIVTIPRARIPIVKFRDPRSGFEVDIAINNSLALHNTELLKAYAECDSRVKELILTVKHWALQRAICDAYEGTFSSYGWTLLAIAHAQMIEPNLAPNLQTSEEREEVKIDKKIYDVTVSTQINTGDSKLTVGELLAGFFERFAHNWNWHDDVVSIANGGSISRKEKGWKFEIIENLHAKFYLMDKTDLISGSLNLTAKGMGLVPISNKEFGFYFKALEEDADYAAKVEQAQTLQADRQALAETLQKDGETMSQEEVASAQKSIQDKSQELEFIVGQIQAKQNETAEKIFRDMNPSLQKILQELLAAKQLKVLLARDTAIFADPALDITQSVTDMLDVAASGANE